MDLWHDLVPAVVILVANLLSGRHGSNRWERVTAFFGWTAVATLPLALFIRVGASDWPGRIYLYQLCGFSLLAAISRDYEKILWPIFRWNRE